MSNKSFDNIQELLRNFKGLTKDETKVLIKIIEKGRVTPTEVGEILAELKLTATVSRPYTMLSNLESKGVIFEDSATYKNKTYVAIHPRDLVYDLKENIKNVDKEIGLLEQLKEVPEYEIDPVKDTKILKNEHEIANTLSEFKSMEDYDVVVYINPHLIDDQDSLLKRLKSHEIDIKENNVNVALISNTKKNCYVVILISKNTDTKYRSKFVFYGTQIVDKPLFDFMMLNVKKGDGDE